MPNEYNVSIFDPVATYQDDNLAAVDLDDNDTFFAARVDHILQALWDTNRIFEGEQAILGLQLGDGTGAPILAISKGATSNASALSFRDGGTTTAANRWIVQFQSNENLAFLRRTSLGGPEDTPLTLNWTTGVVLVTDLEVDGDINHDGSNAGFFGATPVAQQTASGATGYTSGSGNDVTDDGTFTGGVGTAAYTVGDIVAAMKNLGFIASS